MAITCDDSWRGSSNNGRWENHESNLSKDEMIALAGQIGSLPGFAALPVGTAQCFKDLAAALVSGNVVITKGIHQRDSKVHFDVRCSPGVTGTFHVFIKAGTDSAVASAPVNWGLPSLKGKTFTRSLFQYEVSGLSYRVGGADLLYPACFARLDELEKPLGRARRNSLCIGNSSAVPTVSEQQLMLATV